MSSNNKRTHIWIVAFQRVFALSSSQCKWYLDFLLLPKHEPWPCVFTKRWWPFSGPGDKTKCTKCNLSVLGLCAVQVMDENKAEHLLFLGTLSRSLPQSFASHCAQTPGQPLAYPEQWASQAWAYLISWEDHISWTGSLLMPIYVVKIKFSA